MMKFFSPQFRPRHYMGGIFVFALLLGIYWLALRAIFSTESAVDFGTFLHDPYVHQVILFSFWQAFLSAALSLLGGLLLARALFYQKWASRSWILRLLSLTFVLPALVVVFGLMGVYGNSGWLAQLSQAVGWHWQPHFYGLSGILTAHLFFNIPLAARLFLQSFQAIPTQQRQLAAQLNLRGWQFVRLIEYPYLRQQVLPVFSLIFMLCFTSFTLVLTLGGGPKYTTLEVAIYQALLFEFDLPKAALFALLQVGFCLMLFALGSVFSRAPTIDFPSQKLWLDKQKSAVKIWQVFWVGLCLLFVLTPLLHIVVSAFFDPQSAHYWRMAWENVALWRALGYSLTMAPTSAFLALCLSIALLLLSRRLQWLYWQKLANVVTNFGMIILAVPTLVLATGLFIALQDWDFSSGHLWLMVIFCNALAAMPFVIRILTVPMSNNLIYYEKLCQSLGIVGWARWRLIEWHQLKAPIKYAFALACGLSLGDFTAIALFGNQDFTSLPHLLYQQLGSYRMAEAAITALILLLFCLGIFSVVERNKPE